jgi:myo-inositol 2-dehydrogenase/D-chiro-inositol 1-dehydrogenase
VFGSLGKISVQNEHSHEAVLCNDKGIHRAKLKHSFPQRFEQAFGSELDAFCSTLLGKPWPITAEQCIKVQKVADAAQLSCETNQVVGIDYGELEKPAPMKESATLGAKSE